MADTIGLDAFIQEMVRLSAMSLVLNSDKKGLLHLASGNKFTKFPLAHQQLTDMLLHAAPEQYRPGIRAGQPPPPFRYQYKDEPFVIHADAVGGTWSIRIARERAIQRGWSGSKSGQEPAQANQGSSTRRTERTLGWSVNDDPPWGQRKGKKGPEASSALAGDKRSPAAAEATRQPERHIHPIVAMPVGKAVGTAPQPPVKPRKRRVSLSAEDLTSSEPQLTLDESGSGVSVPSGAQDTPVGEAFSESESGWLSGGDGSPGEEPAPLSSRAMGLGAAPVAAVGSGLQPSPQLSTGGPGLPGTLGQETAPFSAQGGPGVQPVPLGAQPVGFQSPAPLPSGPQPAAAFSRPVQPPTLRRDGPPRIDPILRKLVAAKGSDLHLTAGQIPRCRIAGRIQPVPDEGVIDGTELTEMLYEIMPARVRDEFERTKDGDFAHSIEGLARFRVNVGVDRHGVFAVLRVIPNEILKPEDIGLPKKVLDLCFLSKGMVLVTGPTGSGKSTTLATLIDVINSNREDHIITIEDPIEFVHPDNKKCLVRQREVGEHTGSFKRALKAALREDPDIVLVGEMRDLETIAIAIETAATGHLVFGTLHTSTAPSTVDRIIDQFPANQQEQIRTMLSDSLKGVIAQTLCKRIDGGRVAAFEILICNRAVSNLIREGKTFQLYSAMQTSKASGSVTLNASLLELVKQKIISPEEAYIRAVNKEELRSAMAKLGIRASLQTLDG